MIEHLHRPGPALAQWWRLLAPGGVLAVMTSMVPNLQEDFATWHYHRDPTHVSLFSPPTMHHIGATLGADRVIIPDEHPSVTLFTKHPAV